MKRIANIILTVVLVIGLMSVAPVMASQDAIYYIYYADEAAAIEGTVTKGSITEYEPVNVQTTEWSDGWYAVTEDTTINGDVTLEADTNLILCDGKTLTVNGQISGAHNFNIFAGSTSGAITGIGALIAENADAVGDAIKTGGLNIYGGNVRATVTGKGSGIDTESGGITIAGGTVDAAASGDSSGMCSKGDILIFGGSVLAKGAGTGNGIYTYTGTIKISGGTVKARGGKAVSGLNGANIIISGGDITAVGGDADAGNPGRHGIFTNTLTIPSGSPKINAEGGEGYKENNEYTNAGGHGIKAAVNVSSGATPTIKARGGKGKGTLNGQGICGTITFPSGMRVSTSEDFDVWAEVSGFASGSTLTNQFVMIDPKPTPSYTTYHTITYNANANAYSGSMSAQSVEEGKSTTLRQNQYARSGYIFTGWNTKADGTGQSYADGATISPKGNIDLYAQWVKAWTLVSIDEFPLTGKYDKSLSPEEIMKRLPSEAILHLTKDAEQRAVTAEITWNQTSKTDTEIHFTGKVQIPSDVVNPDSITTEVAYTALLVKKKPTTINAKKVTKTYNGKKVKATYTVSGSTAKPVVTYYDKNKEKIEYAPKNAGKYYYGVIVPEDDQFLSAESPLVPITINKAKQKFKSIKPLTKSYTKETLKKSTQTFNIYTTLRKGNGRITYKKKSGNGNLSISSTGKVFIKKDDHYKKGSYLEMKITIKAAETANYNAATTKKTVKVKVK